MHGLLREISSIEAWKPSGAARTIFFEQSDIDTSRDITEIVSRAMTWLEDRSSELDESDRPHLLEFIETLSELRYSHPGWRTNPNYYLNFFIIHQNTLRSYIDPIERITPPPPKLARADTIDHSFDRVTRYLPERNAVISTALSRITEIRTLTTLLREGSWNEIVSCYKKASWHLLAYDALGAFSLGNIKMEQFSTLIFRWSLGKDFSDRKIKAIPLFNLDGSINEEGKTHIKQTLVSSPGVDVVSDEDLETFYLKMKRAPKSEQYFFQFPIAPIPDYDRDARREALRNNTRTITEEIQTVGMNIFNAFALSRAKWRRMSPSLSMMQQLLIAFKGDQAVKIVPVIGLSTVEDIMDNGLLGTREMALPFPTISLPKTADTVLAPTDLDFWNHDFYHAFVASQVPDNTRKAFIQLAQIVKKFSQSLEDDPEIKAYFDHFFERIIDMELSMYRKCPTKKTQFLETITVHFLSAFQRLNSHYGYQRDDLSIAERLTPKLNLLFQSLVKILKKRDFCATANITSYELKEHKERLLTDISTQKITLATSPFSEEFYRETKAKIAQMEVLIQFTSSLRKE